MNLPYLILAIWIVSAVLSAVLARAKGRSVGAWLFVGFLFGPLGLVASAGMPTYTGEREKQYHFKYLILFVILLLAIMLVFL